MTTNIHDIDLCRTGPASRFRTYMAAFVAFLSAKLNTSHTGWKHEVLTVGLIFVVIGVPSIGVRYSSELVREAAEDRFWVARQNELRQKYRDDLARQLLVEVQAECGR